jgi:aspartate--ammonia ligase
MGIRVDAKVLKKQLKIRKVEERKAYHFHQLLLKEKLPQSIGGGIGQSRLVMFMLKKKHIGEVQVGIWKENTRKSLLDEGIVLL